MLSPIDSRHFVFKDVTFFDTVPFFSTQMAPLQGKHVGEEGSSLPLPIHSFSFDHGIKSNKSGHERHKGRLW